MLDWKKISPDPNADEALQAVSRYLASVTRVYGVSRLDLLKDMARDRSVLDIGAGEHVKEYFSPNWEHQHLAAAAKRCVGVDISQELVDFYNDKGFTFIQVDACSGRDLGERFELIFCGDVIEHVDAPVRLLEFCSRHLSANGTLVVTTPNPFFAPYPTMRDMRRDRYFMCNLEHVCWITPSQMNELCRRANLKLAAVVVPEFAENVQRHGFGLIAAESNAPEYMYWLTRPG
jgi:2-polyprenyl-3-methyl-5-hydroxy-6-metoxy-1,4-benzoquinol methylase